VGLTPGGTARKCTFVRKPIPYGNRYPLPLGSDPTRSWECNEKRVAEEYATTSMSIVMPTMARSMTQFGLLMILVVLPMQMLLWWCHARESMPTNRIHRSTFRGNRKAVRSKSTARCGLYSPNSFFVGEANLTRSTPLA
jgi:hypothetical protein